MILETPLSVVKLPNWVFHADEAITLEKLEHVLISPAAEAYTIIKQVPTVVVDHVKVGVESYLCLITPWNWGRGL